MQLVALETEFGGISYLEWGGKYQHIFAVFGPPNTNPILPDDVFVR